MKMTMKMSFYYHPSRKETVLLTTVYSGKLRIGFEARIGYDDKEASETFKRKVKIPWHDYLIQEGFDLIDEDVEIYKES